MPKKDEWASVRNDWMWFASFLQVSFPRPGTLGSLCQNPSWPVRLTRVCLISGSVPHQVSVAKGSGRATDHGRRPHPPLAVQSPGLDRRLQQQSRSSQAIRIFRSWLLGSSRSLRASGQEGPRRVQSCQKDDAPAAVSSASNASIERVDRENSTDDAKKQATDLKKNWSKIDCDSKDTLQEQKNHKLGHHLRCLHDLTLS